jgi:2-polyprenyl-6-methoxyphenol hydroxylase-like FAD-dependent oxidoreductase
LSSEEGAPFQGIRFVNHANPRFSQAATAQFCDGPREGLSFGIGMKRQILHTRLVKSAEASGVDLRWQSQVQLKDTGIVYLSGEPFHYGLLVGADGQGSRVRHWSGLERGSTRSRRFGFRQHFRVKPWSPYVEVHWGGHGQAYVTPVGCDQICVASVARDPHCRLRDVLEDMPLLRDKLGEHIGDCAAEVVTSRERGAVTTTRRLARVVQGRVALVGDASGSADAITGEGMGMAFRQALLLAECAGTANLERYNRLHSDILKLPQAMAQIMLTMDRSAAFRNRAIAMLANQPELFQRMLGVHLGHESMLRLLAERGLEMAWRLAVPHRPAVSSALSA